MKLKTQEIYSVKIFDFAKGFFLPKFKFAITSTIATVIDHGLFLYLINYNVITESNAHLISYPIGMIANFALQKLFIFELKRKLYLAIILAVVFSIIGYFGSTFLIHELSKFDFFASHRYLNKLLVTGIIFFYNFYTKRFAFEKETKKV